ncbi:MAG: hypothetical protein J0I33_07550 [Microbacterium ginsengisoli]|jgi:hypothetical protein|uniref:hypothetical protein n=1 Tax=unclassified Microbacterium TaxID=2609290 RepID=UPI000B20EE6E|nr:MULTISPECIES: hypothetical protein [unclassified Microbacterium]MBN9198478.1 hypothetical protein [Microbacterium ginsengisoli]
MDAAKMPARRTDKARARAVLATRVDAAAQKVAPYMLGLALAVAMLAVVTR